MSFDHFRLSPVTTFGWRSVSPFLYSLLFACLLGGCAQKAAPDPTLSWGPERLYADAREEIRSGNWANALKQLERLEARYPFGKWSQQAQIDTAYVHYRDGERALALAAIDRFLKLYPNHESLDYAFYLKGLINFNEQQGFLANLGSQDLSERDMRAAREAFDSFREITVRWPQSKYADDALARMRYLKNNMAQGELHIARFYFRRGAFVASANRAQAVVRQYQDVPVVEEALVLMMMAYDKLGLTDLKADTERVLRLNYPNSKLASKGLDLSSKRRWWAMW
jgi:outer membrane protein assembly factor BamD